RRTAHPRSLPSSSTGPNASPSASACASPSSAARIRSPCSPSAPARNSAATTFECEVLLRGGAQLLAEEHLFEDVAVERLHHVVGSASLQRQRDLAHVVLGDHVDHPRGSAADIGPQQFEEFEPA